MKIVEIEGICEYRLSNGTRVLLIPDPSKNVVTVNMTIFVGSRHEGYGEAGMAHLLEHMLFKGTPAHPEIPKSLQDRGARFNGTTWVDRTNYYETLPASDENLQFAIRLEADRLINSMLRAEDLASEMTVVSNEFERGENDPFTVLLQRMTAAAFEWHNYGRTTIGNRSDIERVPIERLRTFYRKFYRPDNILVIVAGKFSTQFALETLDASFGVIPVPAEPLDTTYTTEPAQDGERTVVLRRVGNTQLVASLYHIPSGAHPDFAAVRALTYILGDEPSGRLYRNLVETGLAGNVYAFARAYHDPGMMLAAAQVPEDHSLQVAQDRLLETLETGFQDQPITTVELERARQQILKQREIAANSTDNLAVALSDWAAQGDWRLYFLFRDTIEQLTVDHVQSVASRYLVRNNRTLGIYLPSASAQRVAIPPAPNLAEQFADYTGRNDVSVGEDFDPSPLHIEQRTTRGRLIDGIRFALLPKQTRGESVSLLLTIRYGSAESLQGRAAAMDFLPALLARGTESLPFVQLQDELTRLRSELHLSGQSGALHVSVRSKRSMLDKVIPLIADILRAPGFDEREFEVLRRQSITAIEQSLKDPQTLAGLNTRRALAPYDPADPRYFPTLEEELQRIRQLHLSEIIDLHRKFLSSQAGELAIVGDVDSHAAIDQFASLLSDWRCDVPYQWLARPACLQPGSSFTQIDIPDKGNAVYIAAEQFAISDAHHDYVKLQLGNFILGGGALSSRLGNRVRQQEGLSYSVGSSLNGSARDQRTDWSLYAIASPAVKDKLLKTIETELILFRRQGVSQEELVRAQSGYLQQQAVARTDDRRIAALLVSTLLNQRTMEFYAVQEETMAQMELDELNQAIGQYFDPDRLIATIAGDFSTDSVAAP